MRRNYSSSRESGGKAAISIMQDHHFSILRNEIREKTRMWLHKECEARWGEYESKTLYFPFQHPHPPPLRSTE